LVDDEDQAVAGLTAAYWVNFIKTGNPNGTNLPHWPSYRKNNRSCLNIDVATSISHDVDRKRHQLLESLLR
jgi:para-nitrobenzyl esterase